MTHRRHKRIFAERGGLFLMSEVPLYGTYETPRAGQVRCRPLSLPRCIVKQISRTERERVVCVCVCV